MIQETLINESISIEEFSVLFAYTDKAAVAQNFLEVAYGKLSAEEKHGRLIAATHSLLARGLLNLSKNTVTPAAKVVELVDIYLNSQCLFRVGKTGEYGEDIITYHLTEKGILRQKTLNSIAYNLTFPFHKSKMCDDIYSFYDPSSPEDIAAQIDLPTTLLVDLQNFDRSNVDSVFEYILKTSKDSVTGKILAADIAEAHWRGSMVWMKTLDSDNLLTRGTLLIQGKERLWKIQSAENEMLRAETIGREQFVSLINSLIG